MVLDWLTKILIRKFLINKLFTFDKAGFIIESYSYKKVRIFERDIFLPEYFLAELEKRVPDREILYRVGKTFAWNYWKVLGISPRKNLREASPLYTKEFKYYILTFYCSDLNYEILEDNLVRLIAKDYVICKKNGIGAINCGIWAGTSGRSIGNKRVESVHTSCEGRGDSRCEALIGLPEEIQKYTSLSWKYTEVPDYKLDDRYYRVYNRVINVEGPSLLSLLKSKVLTYSQGKLQLGKLRLFPIEVSFLHLLEKSLDSPTIFEIAKETGQLMRKECPLREMYRLPSALGFGIINYFKLPGREMVKVHSYPYSCQLSNFNFPFITGFLSGLFSEEDKEYSFKVSKHIFTDNLTLILENESK